MYARRDSDGNVIWSVHVMLVYTVQGHFGQEDGPGYPVDGRSAQTGCRGGPLPIDSSCWGLARSGTLIVASLFRDSEYSSLLIVLFLASSHAKCCLDGVHCDAD